MGTKVQSEAMTAPKVTGFDMCAGVRQAACSAFACFSRSISIGHGGLEGHVARVTIE